MSYCLVTQANETEIPLLHEYNGILNENDTSVEVSLYLFLNLPHKFKKITCIVLLVSPFSGRKALVVCSNDSGAQKSFPALCDYGF